MATTQPIHTDPTALLGQLEQHRKKNDWDASTGLAGLLPASLDAAWLPAADEIAFAYGQSGAHKKAVALLERGWAVEPAGRRASSLAYLYYSAALHRSSGAGRASRKPGASEPGEELRDLDLEDLRIGFRRWIAEALRLNRGAIKDLYRLGIFEAQVEACHDKAALRALTKVIDTYRAMTPAERTRRHDLRKYYVRALYAAGRSALRLGHVRLARRCAFACIREDNETDHVEPVHKLGLGGRVCLACNQLDPAERAFRMALDAKGPPARDYIFGYLAEVETLRGDYAAGARWIEANVRPERRSAALWRQLGEQQAHLEDLRAAEASFRAALLRDRTGRHLTFMRLAEILWATGRTKEAEKAFRDAIEFRRRHYQSDHVPAYQGLIQLLEARGRIDEAAELKARLERSSDDRGPPVRGPAQSKGAAR